jgi:RsiW-degrading membrane proteinase PrsW (M82 family)
MGNTFFYNQVKNNPTKITWKDILSECRKKHSKRDFEYLITSGTSINTATEADMLQKWKKPWLFYRFMIGGAVVVGIIYIIYYILLQLGNLVMAVKLIAIVIPPLLIPLTLTLFLWELNIPKNLSIYEVLLTFLVGGTGSFLITLLLGLLLPDSLSAAKWAPIIEEPGKLIAALIFLIIFSKNRKIYGINGVVLGAAVGAAFSGFESAQYVANYASDEKILTFYLLNRFVGALGSHTVWCASYTGAIALHMRDSKLSSDSFLNKDFLIMFACAFGTHFLNNDYGDILSIVGLDSSEFVVIVYCAGVVVLEWIALLYIVKRCLYQVIAPARYQSGSDISYTQAVDAMTGGAAVASAQAAAAMQQPRAGAMAQPGYAPQAVGAKRITVICIGGAIKGAIWQSAGRESLVIGRGEGTQFRLPGNAAGISRTHCSIQYTSQGWTIRDLNSSYGTYLNQRKLAAGIDQVLQEGDVISMGGNAQSFRITFQS